MVVDGWGTTKYIQGNTMKIATKFALIAMLAFSTPVMAQSAPITADDYTYKTSIAPDVVCQTLDAIQRINEAALYAQEKYRASLPADAKIDPVIGDAKIREAVAAKVAELTGTAHGYANTDDCTRINT